MNNFKSILYNMNLDRFKSASHKEIEHTWWKHKQNKIFDNDIIYMYYI